MFERLLLWMTGRIGDSATALFLALLPLMAGLCAGWNLNGLRWEARYAGLEATHAQAEARIERTARTALEAVRQAEKEGEELAARLLEAEAAQVKSGKEKDDAIKKLTAGKHCLDGGVVRLLNQPGAPGVADSLSPSPGGALDPDTRAATDTDVAVWARGARDAHDSCRARIAALKEFYDLSNLHQYRQAKE